MNAVWVIAGHEYRVNVRRKGFLFMTLLVPALGILMLAISVLFGSQAREAVESTFAGWSAPVGVVDSWGNVGSLTDAEAGRFVLFADESEGRAALQAGDVGAVLVVPPDYVSTGKVRVLTKGSGFAAAVMEDSDRVRRLFVSRLVPADVDAAVRDRIALPFDPDFVNIDASTETPASINGLGMVVNLLVPYVLSMLLVTTIFVSSGYLLRSVAEEKTSRVIEIMLSSVTARQLLAGKVLGLGALGLTQVAVWLSSSVALSFGVVALLGVAVPLLDRPEILLLSVVYYVLGFLMYAVAMGAVGSLGSSMQESQQLAGIFSLVAAVPFFLAGFLFSKPDLFAARVLSWIPFTAPTMMLLRIGIGNVAAIDIAISLIGLALAIPAVLWAGAKLFRVGMLLTGQRPGPGALWRAFRQA